MPLTFKPPFFQGPDGLPVPGCWHKVFSGKGLEGGPEGFGMGELEGERGPMEPGIITQRFDSQSHRD